MPIHVEWYDNQHKVICQRFEGIWTWEELSTSVKPVYDLAESVPYGVMLLIDMSQTTFMPHGNAALQGLNNLKNSSENVKKVVFVINSTVIKTFAGMVFGMMPKWRNRTQFVKTLAEGQELVTKWLAQPVL